MIKNIALIAHDSRKEELMEWAEYNAEVLSKHRLYATGTTGRMLKDIAYNVEEYDAVTDTDYLHMVFPFKDNVTCLLSGPLGGDAEAGAMIAEGKLDALSFFCDNLIQQGHQNDIYGLTRLASLYNIPFATNRTTADMILTSPLFSDDNYERIIPSAIEKYRNRFSQFSDDRTEGIDEQ